MWLHEYITEETSGLIRVSDPMHDFTFQISGDCPVQGWGTVAEREFYFRARGDKWSCEVADAEGHLPSDGSNSSNGYYREGNWPDTSWIPLRKALLLIDKCMSEYFDQRKARYYPQSSSDDP